MCQDHEGRSRGIAATTVLFVLIVTGCNAEPRTQPLGARVPSRSLEATNPDPLAQYLGPAATDHEIWMLGALAAFQKSDQLGDHTLNALQRATRDIWAASGVLNNGGFVDRSRDELLGWASAYRFFGEGATAGVIAEAAAIVYDDASEDWYALIEGLEDRYYTLDEGTESIAADRLRRSPEVALEGTQGFLGPIIEMIERDRLRSESSR